MEIDIQLESSGTHTVKICIGKECYTKEKYFIIDTAHNGYPYYSKVSEPTLFYNGE